jgi:hypothetical protein
MSTQANHGIAGLPEVNVPTLGDSDIEAEIFGDIQAVFDVVDDPAVLETFAAQIFAAGRRARNTVGIRNGQSCVVREVDPEVWVKYNATMQPPKIGETFNSYRLAGEAIGVGYSTISMAYLRNRGNSLITVRGVTLEKV